MSNTRVVREGKHHRGAFVLFEGRRYYGKELNSVVGHKLRIFIYPGNRQVIKAIRPEGKDAFQLRTRSATKRITNDVVGAYLQYLKEKYVTNRQVLFPPAALRISRQ